MEIKCKCCGHIEETNIDFFVKIIGGALPFGGYWAWTTYLFAGTGFAMGIVMAIIGGGVGMLLYKDEIVKWIVDQNYKCLFCKKIDWEAASSFEQTPQERQTKKYRAKSSEYFVQSSELTMLDLLIESGPFNHVDMFLNWSVDFQFCYKRFVYINILDDESFDDSEANELHKLFTKFFEAEAHGASILDKKIEGDKFSILENEYNYFFSVMEKKINLAEIENPQKKDERITKSLIILVDNNIPCIGSPNNTWIALTDNEEITEFETVDELDFFASSLVSQESNQ